MSCLKSYLKTCLMSCLILRHVFSLVLPLISRHVLCLALTLILNSLDMSCLKTCLVEKVLLFLNNQQPSLISSLFVWIDFVSSLQSQKMPFEIPNFERKNCHSCGFQPRRRHFAEIKTKNIFSSFKVRDLRWRFLTL